MILLYQHCWNDEEYATEQAAYGIALDCGELQMAEKLIAVAIAPALTDQFAGTLPLDIAEELKDLFIQINLRKYPKRRGVQLTEEQLQLLAY